MLVVGHRVSRASASSLFRTTLFVNDLCARLMPRRVSSLLRSLDRFVGTPLVAALSLAPKNRRPNPDAITRIGVLKTAAIGDTLLLAGTLSAIRGRFPQAAVVLVTGRDNAPAAALLADLVDEHVIIRPTAPISALAAIRPLRLDVLLECGPWPRLDALLAAFSGARYRVGFRVAGHARHHGFDHVVDHSSTIHQFENLQNLARAIGVTHFAAPSLRAPGIVPPAILPASGTAVFHPWSGGYMGHVKEWPSERWVELARELHARHRLRILVSGAVADRDRSRALAGRMAKEGCDASSVAGDFSLAELADVLAASDVVATVSLEGPVPLHRWGPIGPRVRSVVSTLPGCGYLDLGFEYAGQRLDCMNGVHVDAVVTAVGDLLAVTA
jgi:heptosyltransferase-3